MRTLVFAALATALLASPGQTQEPKKPDRPSPETMFKRLDANRDGFVVLDELPPFLKERLGDKWAKADKNGDKKLDPAEFAELAKDLPRRGPPSPGDWGRGPMGPRPPWAAPGASKQIDRPEAQPGEPGAFPRGPGRGSHAGKAGWQPPGPGVVPPPRPWMTTPPGPWGSEMGWGRRWGGPPPWAGRPQTFGAPGLVALFRRLDRDGNGQLSLAEFVMGLSRVGGRMPSYGFQRGPHWGGPPPMLGPWAYAGPWGGPPPATFARPFRHEAWGHGGPRPGKPDEIKPKPLPKKDKKEKPEKQ
jgi:Ca2+-binding EF-hand superfamily protein